MFQSLTLFQNATALARHSAQAQSATSRNLANADTPGYRAVAAPDFTLGRDPGFALRTTRPGHLGGGGPGAAPDFVDRGGDTDPNGNSVSIEEELVFAARAKGHHDQALAIYRSGLSMLRTSIGRR